MFVFKEDLLLVQDGACETETPPSRATGDSRRLPSAWQDLPAWCEIKEEKEEEETADLEWVSLRVVWQRWGEEVFTRAGTAYQYMNWLRHARFCSSCGALLSPKEEERGLECWSCGRVVYAPLHPAVIVAVERDGKLLLAHNTRMPPRRYSVIA